MFDQAQLVLLLQYISSTMYTQYIGNYAPSCPYQWF